MKNKDTNIEIFKHLPLKDLLSLRLVSKLLYVHATEASIRANKGDKRGKNLLHHACEKGDQAFVESVMTNLQGVALDGAAMSGDSPLMLAARSKHEGIASLLIQNNAYMNYRRKDGGSALSDAAFQNNVTMVRRLLESGKMNEANVEAAFQKALSEDKYDVVLLFLTNGFSFFEYQIWAIESYVCKPTQYEFIFQLLCIDPKVDINRPNFVDMRAVLNTYQQYPANNRNLLNCYHELACAIKSDADSVVKEVAIYELSQQGHPEFTDAVKALFACKNDQFFNDSHKQALQELLPADELGRCFSV